MTILFGGLAGMILLASALLKINDARLVRAILCRALQVGPVGGGVTLAVLVWVQIVLAATLFVGNRWAGWISFVLVLGLSLSAEAARRLGRIENCGCYGLWLTRGQTRLLDGVLLAATLSQGLSGETILPVAALLWSASVVASGAVLLMICSLRHGRLLPRDGLVPGAVQPVFLEVSDVPRLVLFAGRRCRICALWIKMLTARRRMGDETAVELVFAGPESSPVGPFPVRMLSRLAFLRYVEAVPTAVLVQGGRIVQTWRGLPPHDWRDGVATREGEELDA